MAANVASDQAVLTAIATLRANLTEDQISAVLSSSELRSVSVSSPEIVSTPQSDLVSTPSPSKQVNSSKTSHARERQVKHEMKKNRRPLNGFMGFRAYYSPILRGMPQKARSPMLSTMWKTDPNQSLWGLLGVAFSEIRDKCTEVVSLEKFLEVAAHKVPIVPADQYLEKMGWQIQNATLIRAREPLVESLQANVSPDDLIAYCAENGLITKMPVRDHAKRMIMPFAAAAQTAKAKQGRKGSVSKTHTMIHEPELEITQFSLDVPSTIPAEEIDFDFSNIDFSDVQFEYRPSIYDVTTAQQTNFAQTSFGAHFDPGIEPPVLDFNPAAIQDAFDPFSFVIDDDYPSLDLN